jgi:uncharacterized protein (TIGR02246 family)
MKYAMLAATVVLLFGCAQPVVAPAPAPDLKAQIVANDTAWAAAANRGDAAAVASMYTETATMLPPGKEIQHGRAAIEQTVAGLGKAGVRNVAFTALDVTQVGPDTAREIGLFTADVPGPRKKLIQIAGKFVVIWKHVGDKWLLDTDIWNMDK